MISFLCFGIGACFVWTFDMAFIVFKLIDMTVGLRAGEEDEVMGVDISEHGANAYHDFHGYLENHAAAPGDVRDWLEKNSTWLRSVAGKKTRKNDTVSF